MSIATPQTGTAVVSSIHELLLLLGNLISLPVDPPSLYFDLGYQDWPAWFNISRCFTPELMTYIIDIHILGGDAFSTTNSTGNSLESILESPKIPKVFFNIHNNSNALYSQYHICVDGIIDV
jgi:exonuclease 3'-5' domain-containing protein 1